MKDKINIAELLKDCPKGMELDCAMYDNVTLFSVSTEGDYPIKIVTKSGFSTRLTKYGQNVTIEDAKCVIFPKGKTTWEGFVPPCKFKDGDIVAFDYETGTQLFIFKEYIHNHDYAQCYMLLDCDGEIYFEAGNFYVDRLATEEEKQKLFDTIKANGYKWNAETKTWEEWIMESKIKWQTGEPYESGNYLVTMEDGTVSTLEWYNSYTGCKYWVGDIEEHPIVAWCKLSDIEPYKE